MIDALIAQLISKGILDAHDIQSMTDKLEDKSADKLRAIFVSTIATSQSDWQRGRLRIIASGKD
jgi:hypothetical protein